jgi:uncharacterized coiled-coil protein SlyX
MNTDFEALRLQLTELSEKFENLELRTVASRLALDSRIAFLESKVAQLTSTLAELSKERPDSNLDTAA